MSDNNGGVKGKSLVLSDSIRVDLDRLLGRGGTSDVYAAVRLCDGVETPCAVKFLKRLVDGTLDTHLAKRFEREIKVLRSINDDGACNGDGGGVVRLYDAGVSDRGPWYAMELVQAPTLRTLMKAGPIPEPRVRAILLAIAGILEDLYERHKVIHRDIKPDNVFVFPDGRCKIADLGLAKLVISGQTALTSQNANTFAGTIQYLPPEVVTSPQSADQRSDIYSFGVLGYEMLTGASPFLQSGDSEQFCRDPGAILALQFHAKPVPPHKFISQVTPALEDLLLSCMAKDPTERPQSWRQVIDELAGKARLSNGQPDQRRTSTQAPVHAAAGSKRRGPALTAFAIMLMVGLSIALIAAWGPWRRGVTNGNSPRHDEPPANLSNGPEQSGPQPQLAAKNPDHNPDSGTADKPTVPAPSDLAAEAAALYKRRDAEAAQRKLGQARQRGLTNKESFVLEAKISILERNLDAARSAIQSVELESGHVLHQLVETARKAETLAASSENSPARLRALIEVADELADLRARHMPELVGDPLLHAAAIYYELKARVAFDPNAARNGALVNDATSLDPGFSPPGPPGTPVDWAVLMRDARAGLIGRDTRPAEALLALGSRLPSKLETDARSLSSEVSFLRAALDGRYSEVLKEFENRRLSPDTPGFAAVSVVAEKLRHAASLTENPLREIEWTPRIPPGVPQDKVFSYLKEGQLVLEADTDMGAYTSNLPFARHGFELGLSFSPASDEAEVTLFLTFAKGEGGVVIRVRKGRLLLVEHIPDGKDGKDGTLYDEVTDPPGSFRVAALPIQQWVMVLLDDRPWFVLHSSKPVPDNLMLASKRGTLRLTSLKVGEAKPKDSKDQGENR